MESIISITWKFNSFTLIYTLRKLNSTNNLDNDFTYFTIIGLGALLHRSAIIYGFIFIIIKVLVTNRFSLKNILSNLFLVFLPSVLYELSIYFSGYQSFDWNREVYGQFYWILTSFLGEKVCITICRVNNYRLL